MAITLADSISGTQQAAHFNEGILFTDQASRTSVVFRFHAAQETWYIDASRAASHAGRFLASLALGCCQVFFPP